MIGDLLITTNEAAAILGCGRKGVLRCIEDGRLKADLIATKGKSRQHHYRLRESEVEALAATDWRERSLNGQAKKPRRRKSGSQLAES